MSASNLAERLRERKVDASAKAMREAATAVANDVFRNQAEALARIMAKQMSLEYQAVLEASVARIVDAMGEGIGSLEKAVGAVSIDPQVDVSEIAQIVASLRSDIQNIEIPAPGEVVVQSPPPTSREPSDSPGGRNYDLNVIRDENGFIDRVEARIAE